MARRAYPLGCLLLVPLLPLTTWPTRADVLPPPTQPIAAVAWSFEGIVSLERPIGEDASLSFWGGGGAVWNSTDDEQSSGGEAAIELRSYVHDRSFSGFNVGVYLGVSLFDSDNQRSRISITPGGKLTHTMQLADGPMLVEPYIGRHIL
jgi:hypothetical protein